jgi:hypothetical protein
MNEKPALESLRVRTQPLTVTCVSTGISPDKALLIVVNDMFLIEL